MTEMLKDYQRITFEQWNGKADKCPGRDHDYCNLINQTCEFKKCPLRYWDEK